MSTLDSVLQLSKLEAGVGALEREEIVFGDVVEQVVDLLRPKADAKSHTLTVSRPDRPIVGLCNEDAVYRITRNLVENAIKFTPEEGKIEVAATHDGNRAVLEVEDTGIGIGEEALPQIFRAFKQESEGRDREYEGSGLGLSIVRRLTDELGGRIEVDTEKGKGTCFAVYLPLPSSPEEAPSAE
jgi:signal transduction histidine kinase